MQDASSTRDVSSSDTSEAPTHVFTIEISQMRFIPDSIVVSAGGYDCVCEQGHGEPLRHRITGSSMDLRRSCADSAFMLVAVESSDYYCVVHK